MRTIVVGAGLLLAAAVLLAVAMGGAVADTHDNETDSNVSVGAEVSSFMQASTAEAEGEVDDEMFEAALNRTEDPEERRQLIENRTERLKQRQQRLEERRAEIRSGGGVRDRALAVRVAVGASHVERSANETESVAESVGADTERLKELRTNARNLTGGEVSELARGLAGPPADRPGAGGPPSDSPAGNGTGAPGANASDNRSANRTGGPGADRGNGGSGNASDRDGGGNAGGNGSDNGADNAEPGGPDGDGADGSGGNGSDGEGGPDGNGANDDEADDAESDENTS